MVCASQELMQLNRLLAEQLKRRGYTIGTAESCTGGALATLLTSLPGSSAYFKGGVVAYDESVKMRLLDVCPRTLQIYTVVSEPVACEMAAGVQSLLSTDVAWSTTGVAGPGGGTDAIPVGTVCVCIRCGHRSVAHTLHIAAPRVQVVEQVMTYMCRTTLQLINTMNQKTIQSEKI